MRFGYADEEDDIPREDMSEKVIAAALENNQTLIELYLSTSLQGLA